MPTCDAVWFDPPTPLAQVSIRHPHTGVMMSDVPMLLDSGADVTLIPQGFVVPLGLSPNASGTYELIELDGRSSLVTVVQLEMIFFEQSFSWPIPVD